MKVLGIDPGLSGAFVLTDGEKMLKAWEMPVSVFGKEKSIAYADVLQLLKPIAQLDNPHVYLERAIPMAMGSKGAFNYGRGFEAIVIALMTLRMPFTMVEPTKWAKEMHEGISADLKPKAKSLIAVKRLYPSLVGLLPSKPKGGLKDGPVDALLIAGYGLRRLGKDQTEYDFS